MSSVSPSISRSISNMLDKTLNKTKDYNITLGLLLAASSGILLTFSSSLLRNIKHDIDKNVVLLLRGVLQTTAMSIWSSYNGLSFFPSFSKLSTSNTVLTWALVLFKTRKYRAYMFVFGVMMFFNSNHRLPNSHINNTDTFLWSIVFAGARLSCLFQAWQMIPIAAVQSITNASPVLVMIFSHVILDDRMTLIKFLCCIGYIIGVIFIFQIIESILLGDLVSFILTMTP